MKQRRKKTTRGLILALAVAAVATPVAQARVNIERSTASQSPAALYPAQELKALTLRSVALNKKYDPALRALVLRSEALNAWYAKHPSTPVTVRHADDRAGVRGPGSVQVPRLVSSSSAGFDWGDASIGAGTAVGIVVILMSGVALVRRNQSGHQLAV